MLHGSETLSPVACLLLLRVQRTGATLFHAPSPYDKTMQQTLFYIPNEIAGYPMFGAGILLTLWLLFSAGLLAFLLKKYGPTNETWGYAPVLAIVAGVIWLVLPRVCEPEGLPIRGYGTMLLVAIALSLSLVIWRARRRGLHHDVVLSLAFWGIVPGILGARLFHIIEYWESFHRPTLGETLGAMINLTQGGLVVYGSIIGGTLGILVFLIRRKLPVLATLDILSPCLMLGLALGRIGCLLNGCCFGHVCDLPWAIEFPPGSPAHVHQIQHGELFVQGLKFDGEPTDAPVISGIEKGSAAQEKGLAPGQKLLAINNLRVTDIGQALDILVHAPQSGDVVFVTTDASPTTIALPVEESHPLPVHPTQIYSAINAFLLCLILLGAERWVLNRDGQTFALLMTLYPIARFILEIIRTDEGSQFGTGLTISQIISLGAICVGAATWWITAMRPPGRVEYGMLDEVDEPETPAKKNKPSKKKRKSGGKK